MYISDIIVLAWAQYSISFPHICSTDLFFIQRSEKVQMAVFPYPKMTSWGLLPLDNHICLYCSLIL